MLKVLLQFPCPKASLSFQELLHSLTRIFHGYMRRAKVCLTTVMSSSLCIQGLICVCLSLSSDVMLVSVIPLFSHTAFRFVVKMWCGYLLMCTLCKYLLFDKKKKKNPSATLTVMKLVYIFFNLRQ